MNKIIKITLKWSNGELSTFGSDKEGSVVYNFDIGENEKPGYFYGSLG